MRSLPSLARALRAAAAHLSFVSAFAALAPALALGNAHSLAAQGPPAMQILGVGDVGMSATGSGQGWISLPVKNNTSGAAGPNVVRLGCGMFSRPSGACGYAGGRGVVNAGETSWITIAVPMVTGADDYLSIVVGPSTTTAATDSVYVRVRVNGSTSLTAEIVPTVPYAGQPPMQVLYIGGTATESGGAGQPTMGIVAFSVRNNTTALAGPVLVRVDCGMLTTQTSPCRSSGTGGVANPNTESWVALAVPLLPGASDVVKLVIGPSATVASDSAFVRFTVNGDGSAFTAALVPPPYLPSVQRFADTTVTANGYYYRYPVSVMNRGALSGTFHVDPVCTSSQFTCAVSPSSITLGAGAQGWIAFGMSTGAVGTSTTFNLVLTAPAAPGTGVVVADTSAIHVTFVDNTPPTLTLTPNGGVPTGGAAVTLADWTTLTVDACDVDGQITALTLTLNGVPVAPASIQNTYEGCHMGQHATFAPRFVPGLNAIVVSAFDGFHTTTVTKSYQFSPPYQPVITHEPGYAVTATQPFIAYAAVANQGPQGGDFSLTAECIGAVTNCPTAPQTIHLGPGAATSVAVHVTAGPDGQSGKVRLTLASPVLTSGSSVTDTSTIVYGFTDWYTPSITLSPAGDVIDGSDPIEREAQPLNQRQAITVTACDVDGILTTPTMTLGGVNVPLSTISVTSILGCNTKVVATFNPPFVAGSTEVVATISDHVHPAVQTSQVYTLTDATAHLAVTTPLHATEAVLVRRTATDTFVIRNPGWHAMTYHLTAQCSIPGGVPCSGAAITSGSTVTLAPDQTTTVVVTYNTPLYVGGSTSVRVLSDGYRADASSDLVATAVLGAPPNVTITLPGGATTTSQWANFGVSICDDDDAIVSYAVTFDGQPLTAFGSGWIEAGCPGMTNSAAPYLTPWTAHEITATATDSSGHVTTQTVHVTRLLPISEFQPNVSPKSGSWNAAASTGIGGAQRADATVSFFVRNAGVQTATYALSVRCAAVSCSVPSPTPSIDPGDSVLVLVTASAQPWPPGLRDSIVLTARYTSPAATSIADSATVRVVLPLNWQRPAVLANDAAPMSVPTGSVVARYFTIQNTGSEPDWYHLTKRESGGFTLRTMDGTPLPDSMQLAAGELRYIEYNAVPSSSATTGAITLSLLSRPPVSGAPVARDSAMHLFTTQAAPTPVRLVVTAVQPLDSVSASAAVQASFTIHNYGTATAGSATYSVACAGNGVSACAGSGTVSLPPNGDTTVTVTGQSGVIGQSGTITLTATATSPASSTASDSTTVVVAALPDIRIRLDSAGPGANIERGACLTIAAGPAAAYECGDLRLAHALPTTATMNVARTPTLVYNSRHQSALVLFPADVALTGAADTLTATVTIEGHAPVSVTIPWQASWTPNTFRRIVVPVNAASLGVATGAYHYTMAVLAHKSGVADRQQSVDGTIAIINRSGSAFGPGWWLDGLEQLVPMQSDATKMLWVGGDGSTRLYNRIGTTNVWTVTPTLDRPDTLMTTAGGYERHLRNGAHVAFDGFFRHVATVNVRGDTTWFDWTGNGGPNAIRLPVPHTSSAVRAYAFNYVAGALQSVTAPPASNGARVTTLARSGSVLAITDPGLLAVTSYTADARGLMTSRRNRTSDPTVYDYDAATYLITGATLDLSRTNGAGQTIHSSFCAGEGTGLSACAAVPIEPLSVTSVYTAPQGDSSEVTTFWLNRFGGPRRVVNAIGQLTTVDSVDQRFPLLASKVTANGLVSTATYNERGLITRSVVRAPYGVAGGGGDAATDYLWHGTWDLPVRTTSAMGVIDSVAYAAGSAQVVWARHGTDVASASTIRYDVATGLPAATSAPLVADDSLVYDALGNVIAVLARSGHWTTILRDAAGRDSVTIAPLDSADRTRTAGAAARVTTTTLYDAADRVRAVTTTGAVSSAGGATQSLQVTTTYDDEDRVLTVARTSLPDPAQIGTLVTTSTYDAAGRVLTVEAPDHHFDRYTYDAASNLRTHITRTNETLQMWYDRLHRLTRRLTPPKVTGYAVSDIDANHLFPRYPVNQYTPGITIPTDVAYFTYDPNTGGIATANNNDARVTRTYYPNGALHTERQQIRAYPVESTDFSLHDYTLTSTYDLDGRRTSLARPLGAPGVLYEYDYSNRHTGELVHTASGFGDFQFTWNSAGQWSGLTSLGMQGGSGTAETRTYDQAGQLATRTETAGGGLVHQDSLWYDAQGRRVHSRTILDDLTTTYAGLGAMTAWVRQPLMGATQAADEELTSDAFGNALTQVSNAGAITFGGTTTLAYEQGGAGRLLQRGPGETWRASYDATGNQIGTRTGYGTFGDSSYYTADGKLRVYDRQTSVGAFLQNAAPDQLPVFEEYRYDALGRRVLTRSRRNDCGSHCQSAIERYIWDGDALSGEIRYPGRDGIPVDSLEVDAGFVVRNDTTNSIDYPLQRSTYSAHFGTAWYLYGLAVDKPLFIHRQWFGQGATYETIYDWERQGTYGAMYEDSVQARNTTAPGDRDLVLHYDVNGRVDLGTYLDGHLPMQERDTVDFPGHDVRAFGGHTLNHAVPPSWFGGLIDEMRGASGLMYKRNRYYDPESGRFTQEDPLGLAGGMNLYGFAGGDPVNFSDPFGLDPDTTKIVGAKTTPQPEPSPFGEPSLGPMESRREIGYGGMVLSANELTPADEYNWKVTIQGKPNANANLRLFIRKSQPGSFGTKEYIYSGQLEIDGKYYPAQANLHTLGTITFGFIKAKPF